MNKTTIVNSDDLNEMEKRSRTNLINSLSGYKSANLLGTRSSENQTNLAMISSVFHVGANPALAGFLMRPHTVPRHSLENILEQKDFTLNTVTSDMYEQAHQTAARYPREESEFQAVGFDEEYSDLLRAPYVAQSPIKSGLKLIETLTLEVNETVLVIGEIIELRIDEGLMGSDGHLNMNAAKMVAVSGLDEYHIAQSLGRRDYPKSTSD